MNGPDYAVLDMGYETPCWIWTRGTRNGYGGTSRGEIVHRTLYERANGPIPEGMVLDHLCRHTLCVNSDHLEPVTSLENLRRAAVQVDASRLRRLRSQRVLPTNALANKAYVSSSTIYNLEHSRTRANPSTLRKLAKALSVEPSELIAWNRNAPLGHDCAFKFRPAGCLARRLTSLSTFAFCLATPLATIPKVCVGTTRPLSGKEMRAD